MAHMASQRDVTLETNAQFWITTFYKPGVALSSSDSADRFMAKRWLEIYRDLTRQNERGTLSLIHKHPAFAERLDEAIRAYQVETATSVNDPRYAEARRSKEQALNEAVLWHEMLTTRGATDVAGW